MKVIYIKRLYAGIAQLVERNLAKVEVAGSNPVSRSIYLRMEQLILKNVKKSKLFFDKVLKNIYRVY